MKQRGLADSDRPDASRERRHHARVDAKFEVTVESETNFDTVSGENVSEGGIFVATIRPLALGEFVHVQFTLPGVPEPQRIFCQVSWVRPRPSAGEMPVGMGLRFVVVSPATRSVIERFIAKRAPLLLNERP